MAITDRQMRAARTLLGLDRRVLAERSGLSLPTVQRMEASDGVIRGGNFESLTNLVGALHAVGVWRIGAGAASAAGAVRDLRIDDGADVVGALSGPASAGPPV